MKMQPIPEIGKEYHFFDDGKVRESRHYLATPLRLITKEEAKEIMFDCEDCEGTISLYDIWRNEIDEHRQREGFIFVSKGVVDPRPGDPWLYAEDTDYFVECSIPNYDENNIWFVRTINGGWFSLGIQSWWQGGDLDVDNHLWEMLQKNIEEYGK